MDKFTGHAIYFDRTRKQCRNQRGRILGATVPAVRGTFGNYIARRHFWEYMVKIMVKLWPIMVNYGQSWLLIVNSANNYGKMMVKIMGKKSMVRGTFGTSACLAIAAL